MNKSEFMNELEALLSDIPAAEREEALQYYIDYFEDAGEENEQDVLKTLGTPGQVADTIRKDIKSESVSDSVTPEDHKLAKSGQFTDKENHNTAQANEINTDAIKKSNPEQSRGRTLMTVLLILGAPLWIPLLIAFAAVVFSLAIAWFAIVLSFYLVAIILILLLPVLGVVAILCIPESVAVAAAVLGVGMICAAVGMVFMVVATAMAWLIIPVTNGVLKLLKKSK